MAASGHEDAFPPPRLSGRCRFSQETLAGTRGNGEDAPIPAGRRVAVEALESTDAPGPKSFKKEIDRSPPPGFVVFCGSGDGRDRGCYAVELDPKRNAGHLREDRRLDRRCLREAAKR